MPVVSGYAQTEGPSGVGVEADPGVPQPESTYETPRGLGMGMGTRASVTGTSALAYNTANMASGKMYHIEAFAGVLTQSNAWTLGTAVVDSSSNRLAVGTSFRGLLGSGSRPQRGWDWRTAIGVNIVKQLGLGFSFRWANIHSRTDSRGQPLGPGFSGITVDVALRISPIEWLEIAGLGYNLVKTDSPLAPQEVGGSIAIKPFDSFEIGSDLLVDLTSFAKSELLIGVGLQYTVENKVPLMLGYKRDNGRETNLFTFGIGFVSPKISADIGLRQQLDQGKNTELLFAFRYHLK